MRRLPLHLVFFTVLLLVSGCAAAVMSGAADGDNDWSASQADARITREVRTAIYRDAMLADARITVTARQGAVTLNGVVEEREHITRARGIAAGIAGVREVIIQLRVNGIR